MILLYAELSKLFLDFYTRRLDLNPSLSAAALHSALQLLFAIAILFQATWLGVWCAPLQHAYALAFGLGAPLFAANLIYLRSPIRRSQLLSRVTDQQCALAKLAISLVAAFLFIALLLLKGWIPGVPARLDLWVACPA